MFPHEEALEALGLDETARVADVKDNFRMLVWNAHPDHGGTREKFDALSDAYREALQWASRVPCGTCDGAGIQSSVGANFKVKTKPCEACNGTGLRG
jgi:DnaJ-class molecular chaperone